MTQRPIVTYRSLKGMSAHEIHDDIVAVLGPDAVSYSSVTRHLRQERVPPSKPEPHPADVQRDLDDSDRAILAALEDSLFASVRQLSRLACSVPEPSNRVNQAAQPSAVWLENSWQCPQNQFITKSGEM
jgi:hypothetical protein